MECNYFNEACRSTWHKVMCPGAEFITEMHRRKILMERECVNSRCDSVERYWPMIQFMSGRCMIWSFETKVPIIARSQLDERFKNLAPANSP